MYNILHYTTAIIKFHCNSKIFAIVCMQYLGQKYKYSIFILIYIVHGSKNQYI